jgi:hypothetical protein
MERLALFRTSLYAMDLSATVNIMTRRLNVSAT